MSKLARSLLSRGIRCLLPSAALGTLVALPCSQDPVDIYYDSAGIPHIFGDSDEAAFYGLGWHHMMEYPIGTLNSLWYTSGRMAEIAGASYLDEDRRVRLWELPDIAARHATEMGTSGSDTLRFIEAYVAGVEDGRAWWREADLDPPDGDPSSSTRLDALLGAMFEVNIDPVPDYVRLPFTPFGDYDDSTVPTQIRNVVNRMFDASMPVTTDHVLQLGAAVNSFFLLGSNQRAFNVLNDTSLRAYPGPEPEYQPNARLASNGWMINGAASGGNVLTLSDNHVPLNLLAFRPYIVQVSGVEFSVTGLIIPGYPVPYVGFNDRLSWVVTALGSPAVARNKWRVTLAPSSDPTDLHFRFDTGVDDGTGNSGKYISQANIGYSGNNSTYPFDTVDLVEESDTLTCYDPLADSTTDETFSRYYVPVHPAEPSLGFTRYPVIRNTPPLPEDTIVFEQATFTVEGSPWEFFYLMGMADDTSGDGTSVMDDVETAIDTSLAIFGNGLNLMVADPDGNFLYHYMGRYPEQGPGVGSEDYRQNRRLNGSNIDFRWAGMHTNAEVPRIGPVDTSGSAEVWMNNNTTPDLVEYGPNSIPGDVDDRFGESDLASFPAYMVLQGTSSTWRQEQGDDLLRSMLGSLTPTANEAIAIDKTDPWMLNMWPLFQILRGDVDHSGSVTPLEELLEFAALDDLETSSPTLYTRVQDFMDWVEEYRSHDETDTSNPAYDFVAHAYSQVTVYGTLLQSFYLTKLGLRDIDPLLPDLIGDQATLGLDPRHALFTTPAAFTDTDLTYRANGEVMVEALLLASGVWARGTGFRGFKNPEVLGGLFPDMGTSSDINYNDSRFFSVQEDELTASRDWDSLIGGTRMIRWGHVNTIVLTPHYIRPVKRAKIAKLVKVNLAGVVEVSPLDFIQGYVYSAYDPTIFMGSVLPFPYMEVPHQNAQPVYAFPIGGVRDSLFSLKNNRLFDAPPPSHYAQGIYSWPSLTSSASPDFYYFDPHTSGSQTLLAVELSSSGASARYLIPVGGTETTSDVTSPMNPGDDLSYQDRFAPVQSFVNGDWADLETDEGMLGTAVYMLTY